MTQNSSRIWQPTLLVTNLAWKIRHKNLRNYAVEEIVDICQIPLPKLLEYNLTDALSTWYVREKHYDTMVADQQLEVYENYLNQLS